MESRTIRAVARAYGEHFHMRHSRTAASADPLVLGDAQRGYLLAFRFGATVAVGASPETEQALQSELAVHLELPAEVLSSEEALLVADAGAAEGVGGDGAIRLQSFSPSRLQIAAQVLAKSAVLAYREEQVARVFDQIEPLARQLRDGRSPGSGRRIIRRLGESLLIQTQMVGRVEVTEKPELAWDEPDLDRLYVRLAMEYELSDRDAALTRKLDLIANVTGTYLELLDSRHTLRVEWYIVILILVEIVLTIYEQFLA